MQAIEKGFFISAMKWDMADEQTGEVRSGVSVTLAKRADGSEYNPTEGVTLSKYSNYLSVQARDQIYSQFVGLRPFSLVAVEVQLEKKGKRWRETLVGRQQTEEKAA